MRAATFLLGTAGTVIILWSYNRSWEHALGGASEANRQLRHALDELCTLNQELDRRVEERTH